MIQKEREGKRATKSVCENENACVGEEGGG